MSSNIRKAAEEIQEVSAYNRAMRTVPALVALGLGLLLAGTPAAQPAPACANGSTCTYASKGYANGAPGMCIAGTCTYCSAGACGDACRGLPVAAQSTCSSAVIRANIAAAERDRAAEREKAEALEISQRQLREAQDPTFLVRLSDADLAAYPAKVKTEQARVAVIFGHLGIPYPDNSASEAKTAEEVTKEQTCRATPACMNARRTASLQLEMCALTAEIRAMEKRIQLERNNPSGVVDLKSLHSDGATIQRDQALLAAKAPEFRKVAGKPFAAASMCKL